MSGAPAVGEILGDYRLLSPIGEGGMARVYRAEHIQSGAKVALKVLSADRSQSTIAQRNFALEAEAAQSIAHDNVIRIEAHIDTHPRYRLHVMELLEGGTLRSVMDSEAEMSVPRAVSIAGKVAGALAATHSAGYVHRDIKPENVMVDAGGKVTLIDFGAVKQADEKIASGEPIVGTPLYMAPEQMWGHSTTAKTDIYAFGLMLYEMLAGTLPFKARKFVELREERSTQDPTPLRITLRQKVRMARATAVQAMKRDVPQALEALVMACLARDPAKRPASMAEIAAQLVAMSTSKKGPLRIAHPRPVACRRPPKRTRSVSHWRTALGYAAAALALFISSSTLVSDMHARGPREHALVIAAK
jgi:serine/threonine protein kinase